MEALPAIVYETVYQYSGPTWLSYSFLLSGLVFTIMGVILVVVSRNASSGQRFFAHFFLGFAILLSVVNGISHYRTHKLLSEALAKQTCHVVEGAVENFDPMPYDGHKVESFTVKGLRFAYSDYSETGGFNHTRSHGGPIGPDSKVRLSFVQRGRHNVIVKVELARE